MNEDGHQMVNAHLRAAERNPKKRDQHLTAATRIAEAHGIHHFGRWSAQQITRRAVQTEMRDRIRSLKDGPARAQAARDEDRAARAARDEDRPIRRAEATKALARDS